MQRAARSGLKEIAVRLGADTTIQTAEQMFAIRDDRHAMHERLVGNGEIEI